MPTINDDLASLPPMVPFPRAVRVMGLWLTKAYELRRSGDFPLTLRKHGAKYLVPRAELLAYVRASVVAA